MSISGLSSNLRLNTTKALLPIALLLTATLASFIIWPNLLRDLLSSAYMPHLYCYLGTGALAWTHVVADSLIGLAYLAISGTLVYLIYRGQGALPFHALFLAFGVFIIACGSTHLMEVVTVWTPVYVLSAAIKVVTALASIATAVIFPFVVPDILSVVQKARMSEARRVLVEETLLQYDAAQKALSKSNAVLEEKVLERTAQIMRAKELLQAEVNFRKSTEEQLRLQSAALEAAANAIVITDRHGTMVWVNHAFTKLTGYGREEALGNNPRVLKSGEQPESYYATLWSTISSGNVWHGEIVNRRKDGTTYTEEMTITPVLSERGEIAHFIAVKQDVTERKRVFGALQQAEEKYRTIFEDALVGIYQSTPEGRFLSVNPALARMCGFDSPEQQIAEVTDLLSDLYVDPECSAAFQQKMRSEGMIRAFEHQIRRKDGTMVWLSQNARTVKNAQGEICFYEGTVEDITVRKTLEEQFRGAQRLEAVGRLAGGVAHDHNNMLGVIIGYTQLLESTQGLTDVQKKHLRQIKQAADRAATITRQLLAFSRKQILQPRVLNLNDLAADVSSLLHRIIGEDVELVVNAGSDLGRVKADPGQIEQVIMNLVVNARDAMPGGGKVIIETANADLEANFMGGRPPVEPGHYVLLAVSDTGCGMDEETKARIFEPFFTTKELGKGTGLGLSIVYGIVKQSSGYIWVYSEPGHGTTFKIYLPRVEQTPETIVTPRSEALLGGWETILLVEDESSLRAMARVFLESMGYTVLEAENGQSASQMARRYEGTIHLLLTDVVMPGMSGQTLAEALAASHPGIRLLYMSGYADEFLTQHGILSPGLNLLGKPFTRESLLLRVRAVLDQELVRKTADNSGTVQ